MWAGLQAKETPRMVIQQSRDLGFEELSCRISVSSEDARTRWMKTNNEPKPRTGREEVALLQSRAWNEQQRQNRV